MQKQAIFTLVKTKEGEVRFHIDPEVDIKEATLELVLIALQVATQQGYVDGKVSTISGLVGSLISEESFKSLYESSPELFKTEEELTKEQRKRFNLLMSK